GRNRYRYYISQAYLRGSEAGSRPRINADEVERVVVEALCRQPSRDRQTTDFSTGVWSAEPQDPHACSTPSPRPRTEGGSRSGQLRDAASSHRRGTHPSARVVEATCRQQSRDSQTTDFSTGVWSADIRELVRSTVERIVIHRDDLEIMLKVKELNGTI